MTLLRILVVSLCMVSMSTAAELSTIDGKKSIGEVVSIDAKELVFKTPAGSDTYELTKLNAVDIAGVIAKDPLPGTKWVEVELIDGSQFRCADFKIKGKTAILKLLGSNQTIEFPASMLLYMVRDLSDAKINQAFRGILSKRGKRDIWIVLKEETLDAVNGTFGDGDEMGEALSFELEANSQKINIQVSRIYGMIFNQPPGAEIAQTVCKVVDASKNILYAKALSIGADKSVTVETVTGVKVNYPTMSSIARLDFSAGSLLYLSNAVPVKVEHSSTEGIPEVYRRDRNLDNGELRIKGEKFAKGLALHSRTELTYDLGGKYKFFQTTVGVDDIVDGESRATLIIEADFKPIFKEVITKGDKPRLLKLNIANVKQLRITVESELFDLGNQVDLADAKLLK
ncbi:MAG: NPCBM/NEW2 domain-containing protein [Planctomycetes bacterium]|nr:NPCBM/NEW2 domain-containing protein [Planctomycetota bacterium]